VKEAIGAGADVLITDGLSAQDVARVVKLAKDLSSSVAVECAGTISLENVREYAEVGADFICISALTSSAPAKKVGFNIQPY